MKFSQYQKLALRTEAPLPQPMRFKHAILGLITELGEVTHSVKRCMIYGKSFDDVRENLAEEIGDVCWYLAIGFNACDAEMKADVDTGKLVFEPVSVCERLLVSVATASIQGQRVSFFDGRRDYLKALEAILSDLVALSVGFELDFETILVSNITKLQKRYPDKFNAIAAEARADKGGEDAKHS